jgi:hypothetical protein
MQPEVRPQLFLRGNKIQAIANGREGLNSLVALIDKRIEKKKLQTTRIVRGETSEPHLVMHRSDDAFVSSSDAQLALEFLALLEAQWPEIRSNLQGAGEVTATQSKPEITLKLKYRPNDEFRAVAKIAFETAALLLGAEYVLQGEFDSVRGYIKGDVRLPDAGALDTAVDARFVQRLGEKFHLIFTDQHGVVLYCSPPNVIAFVVLYGVHPYLVRLGTLEGEKQWLRCYEFSYSRDGHREVSDEQFSIRLLERAPELFGLNREEMLELWKRMRDGE